MLTTLQDVRYAARLLLRTPVFTFVAVLTLALGIGANTAIFTIVNGVLLRPLPYESPDRLVMVWQDWRARGGPIDEWASPGNFADWRQATDLFERVAAIGGWRPTLVGGTEPEAIEGEQVSHEYFDVLGIRPLRGRGFRLEDDVPNAPRVAMIGEGLWKRRFGGDPAAVGRVVVLSGEPHEIVGVLPSGARPIVNQQAEVWRPIRLDTANPARGAVVLRVVGRLADGLRLDAAQSAASALARRLAEQHPQFNTQVDFYIEPLRDRIVGDIRPGLLALLGAVAFVLLIACANIANLLLARGSARGRELAVRTALGAGRGRLVRQLLTESLLLAGIGGICGLLVGLWAVDALVTIAPADAPRIAEVGLDGRVFAFALGVTVLTGVLFGLVPSLHAARVTVSGGLKEAGRGTAGASGRGLRRMLISAEVALALVLLTGGSLLLQTFVRLQQADLGFEPRQVVTGSLGMARASYDTTDKQRVFLRQVLEKASALPGVRTAALTSVVPFGGDSDMNFEIEGRPPASSPDQEPVTWYRQISAGYFDVLGIRIVRGQAVADGEPAPSVVVNETFVRRFFAGEDPLGRRIRWRAKGPWYTIVGVAGDIRGRGARGDTRAELYIPYWQDLEFGMSILVKAEGNPSGVIAPLKAAVASIDPNVPVSAIGLLEDRVRASIDGPRFFAILATGFGLLALVLAAVGIYGVMAFVVSQRTSEIGVRMALGATRREVFRLILSDGLQMALIGVALGVAGSLVVARWLGTLLYEIEPGDPLTLAATAGVLVAVAAAACTLPARRATRVDPMVALRAE